MTIRQMAEVSGLSTNTVTRKVKEMYPDRVKNGRPTNLVQSEAITVMAELRKKNFVSPLQNAEVATQNAKVSFLSEKDIAIISQIVSVTVSETIKALDGRMTNIEQNIEQRKILLPAPQLDARAHIKKMIDEYVSRNGIEHSDAYRYLYREFFYRTKCNASLCAKNRGMKTIDYIDDEGMIETLEAIAMEVL